MVLGKLAVQQIPPVWEIPVHLAVAGDVFDSVFLCCHFPTRFLDEIWDIIESVFLPTLY